MNRYRGRVLLTALVIAGAIAACGEDDDNGSESAGTEPLATTADSAPPANALPDWPAPADPGARTTDAGLALEVKEHLEVHRHSHLDVFVDGQPVTVPAAIGIDITDPGVKYFADVGSYGGIEECTNPCISPLHTHDDTGILHTESAADTLLTLGQFFTEWGVTLDDECVGEYCEPATDVAVYIDGEEYDGNPADIELEDHIAIVIVIGTPPATIPDTADFSQA
jgi:hypothetical protein